MEKTNRQINLLSIGVSSENQNLSSLLSLIGREYEENTDLIVLPEMCLGLNIIRMDSEAVIKMRETAERKNVYIVFTFFRSGNNNDTYNTSILIDRKKKTNESNIKMMTV